MAVSVTDPIGFALNRTGRTLFKPFEIGKWFTLGFCAWLAQLGQWGFGFQLFGQFSTGGGGTGTGGLPDIDGLLNWFKENLWLLVLIVMLVLTVIMAWTILIFWLSSRGRFMLLDGVVHNRGAVSEPWRNFCRQGNSLMRFRFSLGVISTSMIGLIVVLSVLIALGDIVDQQFGTAAKTATIVGTLLSVVAMIAFLFIGLWLHDFVVPIMYKRGLTTVPAYRLFLGQILRRNVGTIVLFYLMKLLVAMAISMIATIVTCVTCCLVLLPYVGVVILLPLSVFSRCYSLYMLQQFGVEWRIFPEHVCLACGYDLRGSLGRPTCPECGAQIAIPAVP